MVETVDHDGAPGPAGEADRAGGEAADWFARLSADRVSEADYQAYREWREAAPSNALAYDKIADTWAAIGDHADAPSILEMRLWALADAPDTAGSERRVSHIAAIAASVALVFAITALLVVNGGPFDRSPNAPQGQPVAATAPIVSEEASPTAVAQAEPIEEKPLDFRSGYSTRIGQMAEFRLPDGSVIELNTGSEVAVDYSAEVRNLTLLKGEAVFTVAKDADRPFIVASGRSRVVALGTVFSVRKSDEASEVTLIEGRVRVDRDDGAAGNKSAQLAAGEKIRIPFNQPFAITRAELSRVASWRDGRLVFEQTPLREVLDEFNRYSPNKHVLGDESIGTLLVSGTFRIRSSEHFAATLEAGFPVSVRARSGGTVFEVVGAQESQPIEVRSDN